MPLARRHSPKGQQIIEYLLLFAVIVIVLVFFLGPAGPFRNAVNQAINITLEQIDNSD